MKRNDKLLILAEVCRQRLETLNAATSNHEVELSKDPIEEELHPIIPVENTRLINSKTIIKLNECLCRNIIKHNSQNLQEKYAKDDYNNDISPKPTYKTQNKIMHQNPIITNTNKECKHPEIKKQSIENTDILEHDGTMQIHIYETEFVKQEGNICKIARRKGNLIMKIQHDVGSACKAALLYTTLIQKDSTNREYPVNQICDKHREQSRPGLQEHMMQANNQKTSFDYKGGNTKKSICFKISNKFQSVIGLKFYCNNTCNTTRGIIKLPYKVTKTLLVVTLEQDGIIKAKKSIEIDVHDNIKDN